MSNSMETLKRVGHEKDTYGSLVEKSKTAEQEYFDLKKTMEEKEKNISEPVKNPQQQWELKTIDVDLRLLQHKGEMEYVRSVALPFRANYIVPDDKPLLNF